MKRHHNLVNITNKIGNFPFQFHRKVKYYKVNRKAAYMTYCMYFIKL